MDILAHKGEFAALATAFCWTFTVLFFEAAGKRIGSLPVNLIRLLFAIVFLSIFNLIFRGQAFPTDASTHAWIWLGLSGVVGFAIGDLALFRAFVLIGARLSMLIMALVPPITALIGYFIMGETLGTMDFMGMVCTVFGVGLVVSERKKAKGVTIEQVSKIGIALAIIGAFGQAGGLVLSKYGMRDYDPFAATQIRIIAGIIMFSLVFTITGYWKPVADGFRHKVGIGYTALGAFFGPFLGVSMSLAAVQYTETGVAATIMAMTPVLIIPPAIWIKKETVSKRAIIGALLAVGGVAILFL